MAYDDVILAEAGSPGLRNAWKLQETAGTVAADSGPANNPGTIQAGVVLDGASLIPSLPGSKSFTNPVSGNAILFGDIQDFAGTAPFSWECTYSPDLTVSPTTYRRLFNKLGTGDTEGWSVLLRSTNEVGNGHKVSFERKAGGAGEQVTSPVALPSGVSHLIGTYDGTSLRLYRNGALWAGPISSSLSMPGNTSDLRWQAPGSFSWLSIQNRALTATQVLAHYNAWVASPAALQASPTSLTFNATTGGSNPASQALTISETGGGAVTVSVSDDAPWLTVTPTGGSTPLALNVVANIAGLATGTYNATITASSTAVNSPLNVAVTLNVAAAPAATLGVSPAALSFEWEQLQAHPGSQPLSVTSSGAAITFDVSDDSTWLSAAPIAGTSPATVQVSVDPTGLAPGTYQGAVSVVEHVAEPPAEQPTDAPTNFRAVDNAGTWELHWNQVVDITAYQLATLRPNRATTYQAITGTAAAAGELKYVPTPFPGETVAYGLRTDIAGSSWVPDNLRPQITYTGTPPAVDNVYLPGIAMNAGTSSSDWELARTDGAKSLRYELPMSSVPGSGAIETFVIGAIERGIVPLLLASFPNSAFPSESLAANLGTWAAHYGPGGSLFTRRPDLDQRYAIREIEFGNEQNYSYIPKNQTYQQPGTFARLAKIAGQAIKNANPAVGLAIDADINNNSNWIDGMKAAVPDLDLYVATWVIHCYGPYFRLATGQKGRANRLIEGMLNELATVGWAVTADRPLSITEDGISVNENPAGTPVRLTSNYEWPTTVSYSQAGDLVLQKWRDIRADYGNRLRHHQIYQNYDQFDSTNTSENSGGAYPRERFFGYRRRNKTAKGAMTGKVQTLFGIA